MRRSIRAGTCLTVSRIVSLSRMAAHGTARQMGPDSPSCARKQVYNVGDRVPSCSTHAISPQPPSRPALAPLPARPRVSWFGFAFAASYYANRAFMEEPSGVLQVERRRGARVLLGVWLCVCFDKWRIEIRNDWDGNGFIFPPCGKPSRTYACLIRCMRPNLHMHCN